MQTKVKSFPQSVSPKICINYKEEKCIALQKRNPADTTLTKSSSSTSPVIRHIDVL